VYFGDFRSSVWAGRNIIRADYSRRPRKPFVERRWSGFALRLLLVPSFGRTQHSMRLYGQIIRGCLDGSFRAAAARKPLFERRWSGFALRLLLVQCLGRTQHYTGRLFEASSNRLYRAALERICSSPTSGLRSHHYIGKLLVSPYVAGRRQGIAGLRAVLG
jgi:hypothetical protein